jgi:hypothetical protein
VQNYIYNESIVIVVIRKALAIVIPVALAVSMTGCFDAHFMKALLFGPEKELVGYHDVEGPSIMYSYNTDWGNLIIQLPYFWKETDKVFTRSMFVKKGSTRITLSYNVTMENPNEEGWQALLFLLKTLNIDNETALQILEVLKNMDRHVQIRLLDPDGRETFKVRVNQTTDGVLQYFEPDPAPGEWTLEVQARGFGFDFSDRNISVSYHDAFSVTTVIREPYYR